jgi:hypothetical protein
MGVERTLPQLRDPTLHALSFFGSPVQTVQEEGAEALLRRDALPPGSLAQTVQQDVGWQDIALLPC